MTLTTNLGSGEVVCVFLATRGGKEEDVVDGLNEFQLHDTLYEKVREQTLLAAHLCNDVTHAMTSQNNKLEKSVLDQKLTGSWDFVIS